MSFRRATLHRGRGLHRLLLWPALCACGGFILSGFLHVLVTWTGPQAARPMPPQAHFPPTEWAAMPRILAQHGITEAQVVKLLPAAGRNVLQVTPDASAPRRYFDLHSGAELPDGDMQQAIWLARHYLQDDRIEPVTVEYLTEFDDAYPWVNRLLPVYRLHFAGNAGLTLTVHTETGALADISNHWKRRVQYLFRLLHTFSWLDAVPALRVLLLLLCLVLLLAMLMAGACLLYGLPRRVIPQAGRRWHRRLAHLVWLPLFGFTASGLYHLLHSEYGQPASNLRISLPFRLPAGGLAVVDPSSLPPGPLQSVSLLSLPDGRSLYRAGIGPADPAAQDHHGGHAQRQARFDGIAKEQAAYYLDAGTGTPVGIQDEQVARGLAAHHLSLSADAITAVQKVTRFGDGYDFRNKRLPVWRVDLATAGADTLYVDVATGVLADHSNRSTRQEAWSFSVLHKWNPLTPLVGRPGRDGLIVLTLSLVLLLGWLGRRAAQR